MIGRYLKEQLNILQKQYEDILNEALSNFNEENFPMIIDEINLFWFSNRNLVSLLLNNLSCDFECYLFTGATFLDVDDHEHYPFVTLGKLHIVDDPLNKFSSIIGSIKNEDFAKSMKEQILLTIQDNIEILKNYSESIYILPVTLLSDISSDLVNNAAEQVFNSMFIDSNLSPKKFGERFKSIEDINEALKDGVGATITFSEDDEESEDLCTRFRNHIKSGHPFGNELSEAMVFFYIVTGFFAQAFDILFRCLEYKMIPYLRFQVTFIYTIVLGMNLADNDEMQKTIFKCACAHSLYGLFDKSKIQNIDFESYLNSVKNFDLELFDTLQKEGIYPSNFFNKEIPKVISSKLDDLFQQVKLDNM